MLHGCVSLHRIEQHGATNLTCETQGYLPGDLYVLGRPILVSVMLHVDWYEGGLPRRQHRRQHRSHGLPLFQKYVIALR